MISDQGKDSWWEEYFPECLLTFIRLLVFLVVAILWYKRESNKTGGKEGDIQLIEKRPKSSFSRSYPAAAPLCGLRLWYSTSSTVQTAPLTFSTRIKHLWRDKLWRTAFYSTFGDFSNVDFLWKGIWYINVLEFYSIIKVFHVLKNLTEKI